MDKIIDKISWKNSKVLVTGADGFIGSHVAKALAEKGSEVVTIVRDIKKQSNIDVLGLKNSITIVPGDLVDYADCERAINEYDIDFCFHIAAQAIVGPANRSPLSTFESNIKGTWNILEAARLSKTIKGMIIASSDKAYGQQKKLPYTEDSPLNGYFPYDASKACAEMIARSYFMTYNLPLAITRNANTYGPADMNLSRIIPDVITRLLKNKEPVIRSDGTPERDYMYIKDAVAAYLVLAENLHKKEVVGQAFNFGTGKPISVLQLYKKIISLMGKNVEPKILGQAKNEIDGQYLDSSKAKRILGWEAKYDIDKGLKETIEWYKGNFGL
ncbi:TPA: SDR family NAD(P)-dependent oxidoreductase [Candidatus Woesearchaeota archaeon]|uniref:dTDP-glucose 4,6-dehydratase n=1 Tax=Candidatus Nomurabacteria bacterium GW2011_GWA2_40_9 TaxID=1618734 RepID=A0A0G0TWC7_9BACT|nr:MAG: dTDP-glucose 4,6-dehydratase [Candidatus Nomurabacteria bacterium GW2011_GWA2_40_9]HIH41324.1 SDR family NAD(P)-dependent oxidoreductase [Candidatus Woesearchaeota archaeon]